MNREGSTDTYILPCVKQPASGKLLNGHKEPDLVLCGSLEEWDGVEDGRKVQEGGDISIAVAGSN